MARLDEQEAALDDECGKRRIKKRVSNRVKAVDVIMRVQQAKIGSKQREAMRKRQPGAKKPVTPAKNKGANGASILRPNTIFPLLWATFL